MRTLQHRQIVEDAAKSRVAPADHICVFLKPGENAVPITHTEGFRHYPGTTPIPRHLQEYLTYKGDQRKNLLSHWVYRQLASPIWMDVRRGRLIPCDDDRENPEEKHVCRLQLDVIERCLMLWSNPGDVMLTPFAGVGSEIYQAVRMGRKAIGMELKASYWRQAVQNIPKAYLPEEDELSLAINRDEEEESLDWFNRLEKDDQSPLLPVLGGDDDEVPINSMGGFSLLEDNEE